MNKQSPLVSIIMLTYNHEKYIREALDSIVYQKTSFPFEVLVGDDASHDHTPQIIQEYANKYPNIVIPILRKKNLGANQNYIDLVSRCNSDYIAFLDGDDCWATPNKLQIQVTFLEKHPEFGGVSGWVNFIDHKSQPLWYVSDDYYCLFPKHIYKMCDFQRGKVFGQGGATMLRNFYKSLDFDWRQMYSIDPLIGDQITTFLASLNNTKIYVTKKRFSNYRFISSENAENYTSKINNKTDAFLYYFRYYNSLEQMYTKLTRKRVSLLPRKSIYLHFYVQNALSNHKWYSFKNALTILKEEKHPIKLINECIKFHFKEKKHKQD